MRPLALLGLIAFFACWFLAGLASADELEGAKGPLLVARAYADYRYQPQSEWVVEQASLGGGESVSVDVDSWGAVTFTLELRGEAPGWTARADDALRSLRTTADGERVVRELEQFVSRIDRAAQLRGEGWTRYDLCRDGSLPSDDGCGPEMGGGFSAEVSARGGQLQVVLTDAP